MELSQSQDQSSGFDRSFFLFFSIKLSQSNDSGHEFDGLTQVVFMLFF
jgi:hypothetical protein